MLHKISPLKSHTKHLGSSYLSYNYSMYVRVRRETIYPYLKIRTVNVDLILTRVRLLGFQVSLGPIPSNDILIKKKQQNL